MTNKILDTNKAVATSAAFMEAGRLANNQVAKLVAKKAPLMVRGYVETSYGKVVIANLLNIAVEKFRPGDEKLEKLSKAMMVQAYQAVLQDFDIEGILEELFENTQIKRATKMLDQSGDE